MAHRPRMSFELPALLIVSALATAACADDCPHDSVAEITWAPDALGPLPTSATLVLDDELTIELTCRASGCDGQVDDIGVVVTSFTYVVEGDEVAVPPRDIVVETDPVSCTESYVYPLPP